MDLMEQYRQKFFAEFPPISVSQLRPKMKIVVPDDPLDYGGGDLFMEVIETKKMTNGQLSIVGKLTHPHTEIGAAGVGCRRSISIRSSRAASKRAVNY